MYFSYTYLKLILTVYANEVRSLVRDRTTSIIECINKIAFQWKSNHSRACI